MEVHKGTGERKRSAPNSDLPFSNFPKSVEGGTEDGDDIIYFHEEAVC